MFRKSFLLVFTIISTCSYAQFGFERNTLIEVVQSGEIQKFPWAGGMDYCQYSSIDLDFDGVEDLFVFDRTCNKVLTFLQKGAIGETDYEYAPEYEKDFPADLHDWALLVDYDCDGLKDLFTSEIGGGRVFRNTGTGDENTFELVVPLLVSQIYGGDSYMYMRSSDIPAIVDIDGDGDKDVLAFGVLGTTVEYHKNMSMELYDVCDSLVFETKSICWGRFREASASNEVSLWDTLVSPCTADDLTDEFPVVNSDGDDRTDRHIGSSVLALDMDNSGVMDLVLGDASYKNMVLLMNSGEAVNTNSGMDEQDLEFPSNSVPVDIAIFPAGFHVDLNNDGIRDLMACPNSVQGSENVNSNWRYMNIGEDLEPEFIYQESNFLQGEMIENGTSSLPVFFDHSGDGLLDLLVSSQGQYDVISGNQKCKIAYYENVGTADTPIFEFVTDDYEDLSTLDIGASLAFYPTFGDLDGDGDEDMILGEYVGYCYYLENTGGAGSPAIFNTFITLNDSDGEAIFQGTYSYPLLKDLDRDGDMDLVIGRRTGKLQYLENSGIGTYNFVHVTNELGGVDVSGEGFIQGHAIPQFVDLDGEYHLVVGSKRGNVYYYDAIDENLDGTFHLVDPNLDHINIGTYTAPAIANLNGNDRFEMVLGNRRGGVVLFESATASNIGIQSNEPANDFNIFPNPTKGNVTVNLGNLSAVELKHTQVIVYSLTGNRLATVKPQANSIVLDLSKYAKGTYIINVIDDKQSVKKKLVIQ
ncbi:MAG: hypothetical protein ACI8ZM_004851 [Crocinitomix sp.]|jgi:hypothetical protein